MDRTIYVQIAAYRDPELVPTIQDLLDRAESPDDLRIGVMWQRCADDGFDDISDYRHDPRFRIYEIDYTKAKGACYARYILNMLYCGERYTMQIDSHHRFAEGWDKMCIDMLEGLRSKGHEKPLLSSYPPSYFPEKDPEDRGDVPVTIEFCRFDGTGTASFQPVCISGYEEMDTPVPAKFIAAGFIFADGSFCKEVTYDPSYYFLGEEMDLSVRAYMAGYDIFAPHKVILWHEYIRKEKPHHWGDHKGWSFRDKFAALHNIAKYGNMNVEPGIRRGIRSLYEYERYAGIDFRTKTVHLKTLNNFVPPISNNFMEHMVGLVDPEIFESESVDEDHE